MSGDKRLYAIKFEYDPFSGEYFMSTDDKSGHIHRVRGSFKGDAFMQCYMSEKINPFFEEIYDYLYEQDRIEASLHPRSCSPAPVQSSKKTELLARIFGGGN